ncbi:MAG: hypothetical protein AAF629_00545, partial [Chloroflexota bacterium]
FVGQSIALFRRRKDHIHLTKALIRLGDIYDYFDESEKKKMAWREAQTIAEKFELTELLSRLQERYHQT